MEHTNRLRLDWTTVAVGRTVAVVPQEQGTGMCVSVCARTQHTHPTHTHTAYRRHTPPTAARMGRPSQPTAHLATHRPACRPPAPRAARRVAKPARPSQAFNDAKKATKFTTGAHNSRPNAEEAATGPCGGHTTPSTTQQLSGKPPQPCTHARQRRWLGIEAAKSSEAIACCTRTHARCRWWAFKGATKGSQH